MLGYRCMPYLTSNLIKTFYKHLSHIKLNITLLYWKLKMRLLFLLLLELSAAFKYRAFISRISQKVTQTFATNEIANEVDNLKIAKAFATSRLGLANPDIVSKSFVNSNSQYGILDYEVCLLLFISYRYLNTFVQYVLIRVTSLISRKNLQS